MSAAARALIRKATPEDQRLLNRGAALQDALRYTVGMAGLTPMGESDIWGATMERLDVVLHLADGATVALLELEATDRRLTAHEQTHDGCSPDQPCDLYRLLKFRRRRLWDTWVRAYHALCGGRR